MATSGDFKTFYPIAASVGLSIQCIEISGGYPVEYSTGKSVKKALGEVA